jgi:hypothetical protein
LRAHNVSKLETPASQDSYLFGTQFAPNFDLRLDSHAQLCRLCRCELIYPLFDNTFVNRVSVERLIQSNIRLAQSSVCALTLVFVLFEDNSNALALFGCEAELFDRVGWKVLRRILCGEYRDCECEEQSDCDQSGECSHLYL